ncbi:hypothetical protein AURDEDRAFT_163752 [Auricularia subglabra TFB-10046 SS5]|nr:hypothetical protein AURDEDRAFT_163752 [Auricularia subglabra TFB-10046 SS5]
MRLSIVAAFVLVASLVAADLSDEKSFLGNCLKAVATSDNQAQDLLNCAANSNVTVTLTIPTNCDHMFVELRMLTLRL